MFNHSKKGHKMIYFEDIIEEIEKNLTGEIDVAELAKKANMSLYEFRRIFSFVAKIPLNEYIRKRRLSQAAVDLYQSKQSVTEIAFRYGYDSASSFSRAFREFHGVAPSEAIKEKTSFSVLTRLSTQILTTGGESLSYQVLDLPEFWVHGICGESAIEDTECCERVWEQFYNDARSEQLCKPEQEKLYAVYDNQEDCVRCLIGNIGRGTQNESSQRIPESLWVCFGMRGTDDETVNGFYHRILWQWFASVGYERNPKLPNIEVYPVDMSGEEFDWEIWIPVIKKVK